MFGSLGPLVPFLVVAFSALGAKGFTYFVQEGSMGVKVRFGRVIRDRQGNVKVIKPGFHFRIPVVYRVKSIYVRSRTLNLGLQSVILSDLLVVQVATVLQFEISNVYNALFQVDNLEEALRERCAGIIHQELSQCKSGELGQFGEVQSRLHNQISQAVADWGVSVKYLGFTQRQLPPEAAQVLSVERLVQARLKAYQVATQAGLDSVLATVITTGAPVVLGSDLQRPSLAQAELVVSSNGHAGNHGAPVAGAGN